MDKKSMHAHMGSLQQEAYIRPVTHLEGRAQGLTEYLVKNGPLHFSVMAGKCLDISDFSYKGVSFHFLSKPGLTGRQHYDTHGQEALRSIMGGFLFTSGLESICAPCVVNGKAYPMHGRLRSTPAEHASADACWEGDRYCLSINGEMREAELFGENLVLRRQIETIYGEKSITLRDEIENLSYRDEPIMLLYHINFGYPLLAEGTRIILPTEKVMPRDEAAAPHVKEWNRMAAPKPNEPEYVFLHDLKANEQGNTFAAIVNDELGLGMKITYHKQQLPYFMEWMSTAAGDYALGLEPANASVYGRLHHEKEGTVPMLAPFVKKRIELTFTVLEKDEIKNL